MPAFADGEAATVSPWSGSVSFTSDYRFRGISQTDRNPALQGEIQYTGSQGVFAGAWASNVDFADGSASWELDLFAGYTHAFNENTSGTVKVTYYVYPESNAVPNHDLDYFEASLGFEHDMGAAVLSLEAAYSPDYFGGTGAAISVQGGVEVPVVDSMYLFDKGLTASGHVGHQMIDDNVWSDIPDYTFYDIGFAATAGAFSLDVRYHGTDIDEVDCVSGTDWCEGGVVVTGSLSFGG